LLNSTHQVIFTAVFYGNEPRKLALLATKRRQPSEDLFCNQRAVYLLCLCKKKMMTHVEITLTKSRKMIEYALVSYGKETTWCESYMTNTSNTTLKWWQYLDKRWFIRLATTLIYNVKRRGMFLKKAL